LKYKKAILIVLDSVGVGALPDAGAYGDEGANTISHIAHAVNGLALPHLTELGLGNIDGVEGLKRIGNAQGCFGKMAEASAGKDSTTGHWEIAGLITKQPFPLYPHGFPGSMLDLFLQLSGCNGYLGNKPASGTEIINELGDEHVRTGFPIIYTSGDSVFQIAAHKDVIPLKRLYEICRITRERIAIDEHRVGRVIARPFIGTTGRYVRTPERRDYAVEPPAKTILDLLSDAAVETIGIGKIGDLFCGRGLRRKIHTRSNAEGIDEIVKTGRSMRSGFLMANLVDFDMLYGHRQDAEGFAKALEEFDSAVPDIRNCIGEDDLLILTADHGNDPTDQSTDHTREYVPVLSYSVSGKKNVHLGLRDSFADTGKTIAEFFACARMETLAGKSFFPEIV
jgi:phosphopentomutase